MQFADIKNDIAFRKIFGNENRKEALISFLNSILAFKGKQRIVSVDILNPFQLPKLKGGKVTIIDVKATDQIGRQYIVEMQVAEQDGFDKRVLYYTSKSYTDQIKRGDFYKKLKPAIFIGVLDFVQTINAHYISRSRIQDIDTGEITVKDVEFNFIELPKFNLKEEELTTLSEKWIYFIKNAENLDIIPDNTQDEGLKSAYQEANQHNWSKEEMDAYDYAFMREEDLRLQKEFAINKAKVEGEKIGLEKGIEKGEKIGIEKGEKIGIEKGEKIGEQKAMLKLAKMLKKAGEPTEKIQAYTGLTLEEIENL
jgi:predicted transposase/invertase (TIGR01784 family)